MKKLLTALALSTAALGSFSSYAGCGFNEFCAGSRAVYNEYDVTILELFSDGNARIQYSSGTTDTVSIGALSKELYEARGFTKNSSAIYNEYDVTILELFADGNARIRYSSGTTDTVSISALRHIVNSAEGFSVGDQAVYNEYDVKILEIFDDGNSRIQYSSGTTDTVSTSALRHVITAARGFYKGEQAIYNEYDITILEIFTDGNARIQYSSGTTDTVSLGALNHRIDHSMGFKVGQQVTYNEYNVTILELFEDGNARIQYSSGSTDTVSIGALRLPIACVLIPNR